MQRGKETKKKRGKIRQKKAVMWGQSGGRTRDGKLLHSQVKVANVCNIANDNETKWRVFTVFEFFAGKRASLSVDPLCYH